MHSIVHHAPQEHSAVLRQDVQYVHLVPQTLHQAKHPPLAHCALSAGSLPQVPCHVPLANQATCWMPVIRVFLVPLESLLTLTEHVWPAIRACFPLLVLLLAQIALWAATACKGQHHASCVQ